jgi:transposase-like protein
MSKRKRLSRDERLAIVRERRNGVTHKALAQKFGVTERTIYYTLRTEKERKRDNSTRTKTVSVTLTPDELRQFDAVLSRYEITNRSEALRRLILSANGIFQPDEHLASELQGFRAALNKVGSNVSQIARRLNEARNKGIAPAFGIQSLNQVRALAGFVMEFADEIDLLARRRVEHVKLTARAELKELADGAE